jgi:DNA polymerase (family 10)
MDLDKVIEAASKMGVFLEINAFPERLDLSDVDCRKAMEAGVKISIGTDSHASNQMDFMTLGVSVARRGWLGKENVVNTLTVKELLKLKRV